MASGSQNLTTYKANLLAHTPNDTSLFLRGDNIWTNILTDVLNLKNDLNLYTSSADSPDIVWWYADKGQEQARIWISSDDTSVFAPKYRCYNTDGTSLYSGNLVLGNGTGASGTWDISISGNAATATSTRYIQCPDTRSTNPAPSTFSAANGVSFDFKQGSVIGLTSESYSGVMSFRPYSSSSDWSGGNAHQLAFNNAGLYWRQGGSDWGDWTQIVTCGQAQNFTGNKSWGVGGAGGILYGNATNGGINSIRIGDDVYLGDCNVGGIMGMKSTGSNCGFYFYNSSGTQIGQLYSNGSQIYSNLEIRSSSANGFRLSYGSYGVILRNDGADFYFLLTSSGQAATGGWSGLRPYRMHLADGYSYFSRAYSAVWNDYAEFRASDINEPGRVIIPSESGKANLSIDRLQAGGRVISDTYGNAVGESDQAKTPVGLAGRVLAYPYRDRNKYKIGDAVCSAPGGTVDIMTREEIMTYPDRIIGIVNEIPDYEVWESTLTHEGGGGQTTQKVEVKGRIWIDIK